MFAFAHQLCLQLLTVLGRKRIILNRDETATYIERYYLLFPQSWEGARLPFNVYLHQICLSDEPVLHDHPWHWAAFILCGGYWEQTPEGGFWRGAGSFRRRSMLAPHYLTLDPLKAKGQTWTLFFVGRRQRDWGFIDSDRQWTQWHQYLHGTKIN